MTRKPNIGDWDYQVLKRGYDLTLTALLSQYHEILTGNLHEVKFPSNEDNDQRCTATILLHRPIARIYCGLPLAGSRATYHHRYISNLYYENGYWHCELGDMATPRVSVAHVSPVVDRTFN